MQCPNTTLVSYHSNKTCRRQESKKTNKKNRELIVSYKLLGCIHKNRKPAEQIPAVDLPDINTLRLDLFPAQQSEAQPYVSKPPPPQIFYSFSLPQIAWLIFGSHVRLLQNSRDSINGKQQGLEQTNNLKWIPNTAYYITNDKIPTLSQ